MDPNLIIGLASAGINAALEIIAHVKAQSGLTDDQIMAAFNDHAPATKAAIAGYLAALGG